MANKRKLQIVLINKNIKLKNHTFSKKYKKRQKSSWTRGGAPVLDPFTLFIVKSNPLVQGRTTGDSGATCGSQNPNFLQI